MRSIFLVLSAYGAVSHASECQASDEATMLQGLSMMRRKHAQKTSTHAWVKKLREVAESLTEGSTTMKSHDEVNDALAAASEALANLSPAIQQQVQASQSQINHAAEGVQACHAQSGINLRNDLQTQVDEAAAALTTCQAELAAAEEEATTQCAIAQDCLCDEANERLTGKQALCESMTDTYEMAYCEHRLMCEEYHHCHTNQMTVYENMRTDVEAEMATVEQEYIAAEQSTCLTNLIMTAMMPPITPIDPVAMVACNDVDTSVLAITYPTLPDTPAACPEPTMANPPCVGTLWPQTLIDRTKCNNNIDVQYVENQRACEEVAVAAGHDFYSFRHNGESAGHKCFSSQNCDDDNGLLLGDRTNEWKVYRRSFPNPAVLRNAHSDRRMFAQDWNSHEDGVGAANGGNLYADQRWVIEDAGDDNGAYIIRNAYSGRRLFAQDSGTWSNGVGASNGDTVYADQKWFIVPDGDSKYVIRNVHSSRRLYAQADQAHEAGFGADNNDEIYADQKWYIDAYEQ